MNQEAIHMLVVLRTLRDRLEHEVGQDLRDTCKGIYILNTAIDTIEANTSAEISYDLGIPSSLPNRDWCRGCGKCGGRKQ